MTTDLDFDDISDRKKERNTPWLSVWMCIILQVILSTMLSIYWTSMWPYLSGLDSEVSIDFMGWIIASCSVGCTLASPFFGWWNQKTMSVRFPVSFGFLLMAIGQAIYGLLPVLPAFRKWFMLLSRLLTGLGMGSMSTLRAYVSTAPLPEDQFKAISYGYAGYTMGILVGPFIQTVFTPVLDGFKLGPIVLNMYTLPAYTAMLLLLTSIVCVHLFLREDYAGILEPNNDEGAEELPKFDRAAAALCCYFWIIESFCTTIDEVLITPLLTVIYNFNDAEAVTVSGILLVIASALAILWGIVIGNTRVGKIDKRKLLLFGLSLLWGYHFIQYPFPFYPGPLSFIPEGKTSAEVGGCLPAYTWCEHTPTIPKALFYFAFIMTSFAYVFTGTPSAGLFSDVLGPRPQGFMQGIYSFSGSSSQLIGSVLASYLFHISGYKWIIVIGLGMLFTAIFYRKLVPLVPSKDGVGKN